MATWILFSAAGATFSGSITIQVGRTAQTNNVGDSSTPDTLSGLMSAINSAKIGGQRCSRHQQRPIDADARRRERLVPAAP